MLISNILMLYRIALEDYTKLVCFYSEKIVKETKYIEKSIHEGSCYDTSEIFSDEP